MKNNNRKNARKLLIIVKIVMFMNNPVNLNQLYGFFSFEQSFFLITTFSKLDSDPL